MARINARLNDDLYDAARAKCKRLDLNLSQVIRQFLREWTEEVNSTMYVYIQSEPGLYTVGFYSPDGRWHTDSDHTDRDAARERVHYLNGGK